MKTTVHTSIADLATLTDRWRGLLDRAAAPQVAVTPTWTLAWWRQFGEDGSRKLRALSFEDGGELVGLALLCVRLVFHRHAVPFRRVELLMTGEPDADEICSEYVGVIAAKGREADVAEALARALRERLVGAWDDLLLTQMSGDDPVLPHLRAALGGAGIAAEVCVIGAAPYIPIPESWDAYLKSLTKKGRYVASHSLRELEKWVGKDFEVLRASTTRELEEGWRVLRTLHGERWSVKGKAGVWASDRFTRFHADVMSSLLAGSPDGSLELWWLVAKGEPIAAAYNIVHRGKILYYQSGRKMELPKTVQPGIALIALTLQRGIEARHREYDFLNGASQYKRQLSLASRELVMLRATAPTVRARAVERTRDLVEEAIRKVDEVRKRRAGAAAAAGGAAAPAAEQQD